MHQIRIINFCFIFYVIVVESLVFKIYFIGWYEYSFIASKRTVLKLWLADKIDCKKWDLGGVWLWSQNIIIHDIWMNSNRPVIEFLLFFFYILIFLLHFFCSVFVCPFAYSNDGVWSWFPILNLWHSGVQLEVEMHNFFWSITKTCHKQISCCETVMNRYLVGVSAAVAAHSLLQLLIGMSRFLKNSSVIPSRNHAWLIFAGDQVYVPLHIFNVSHVIKINS